MKVILQEIASGKTSEALIAEAVWEDMPSRKDGWEFTWRKLFKTEGA
jgi:hypothetical protein